MIDDVMGSNFSPHSSIAASLRNLWCIHNGKNFEGAWDIYTDGSLHRDNTSQQSTMGLGWVNISANTEFSCAINKWPSSTRAELGAIWTALLTILSHSAVNVYTDSAATISGINNVLSTYNTTKWTQINNKSLLLHIRSCIFRKTLNLTLHKIKGHSDNTYNDIADSLAKGGLSSDLVLDLDFSVY